MSDFAITNDNRANGTEYIPFWKKDEKPDESFGSGACHMAFNSAFDVAAGREKYNC